MKYFTLKYLKISQKNFEIFQAPCLKYFTKFLVFIIRWIKTFKNIIKVYEVSRKYIMLFVHNNRYLPLTGLLTYFVLPEKNIVKFRCWFICWYIGRRCPVAGESVVGDSWRPTERGSAMLQWRRGSLRPECTQLSRSVRLQVSSAFNTLAPANTQKIDK